MSPLQRLYESLSGTLPGGFSLWVVILLIVWAIWYFTYRSSGVISPAAFRRWGIYLTLVVVAVYSLQRVRHPAPLAPQRVWVQPFAAPAGGRTEAEQARYALERTLEAARERIVAFQARNAGSEFLTPTPPSLEADPPEGARLVRAERVVTGEITPAEDGFHLRMAAYTLSPGGRVKEVHIVRGVGADPASAGKNAALALLRSWALPVQRTEAVNHLTPRVLAALAAADTLRRRDPAAAEAALLAGFAPGDSTSTPLWEELALLYLTWHYPKHKVDAEEAARAALRSNDRSWAAYYVLGSISWRMGGRKKEAVAAWKLAHLYNRRDARPMLALARLDERELRDLRMGSREMILRFAMRLRPADPMPRAALSRFLRDRYNQKERALAVLDEGLRLNPDEPRLLIRRGAMMIKLRRWKTAERDFRRLLAVDSTMANAWYNLGIVARGLENDSLAQAAFENAVRFNGPPDAHYYLGLVYESHGDTVRALEQYRRRWLKWDRTTDDLFAYAAKMRLRLLRTGRTITGQVPRAFTLENESPRGEKRGRGERAERRAAGEGEPGAGETR